MRPVDDPLRYLLADRRRVRARLSDGLWLRLADLPAALTGRCYAGDVDVVLEVSDELLPENSGRWRLEAAGPSNAGPGGTRPAARCERTRAPADLEVPVAALAAAYLGGTRLGALAGAGQLTELRPGALAQLSTAMSWDPAPWCPYDF